MKIGGGGLVRTILTASSPVVGEAAWTGPTSGLIAGWPMNDRHIIGSTVKDTIGTNDGTITGGITSGVGPAGGGGYARVFDGTTGYITLGASPLTSYVVAQAYTFAAWVRFVDPTAVGSGGGAQRVFNFSGSGATTVNMFSDNTTTPPGQLTSSNAQDPTTTYGNINALPINAWRHLAVTNDGAGALAVYINAVNDITGTSAGGGAAAENLIGARSATGPLACFNGGMAEFVVYNRALSGVEILTLKNAF